jgi:hypothetical protein
MRVSILLPLVCLALGACVTESARPPQANTTTYVVPQPTTTYVSPPATQYVAPGDSSTTTTTVRRTY